MARYASCIFGFVSAHNRSEPDTCIPRRTSPQPPLCPPHGGLDAILIPGCLIVSCQLMAIMERHTSFRYVARTSSMGASGVRPRTV